MSKGSTKGQSQTKRVSVPVTSFVSSDGLLGEMLYDQATHTTRFMTFYEGFTDEETKVAVDKRVFEPYSPYNPLLTNNVIKFPNTLTLYESTASLKKEVRAFIARYMELPKTMMEIACHYVLLTWIYDTFNELPYLRVRGDFGAGKTRFLSVVSSVCYKPIMASGASTVAPLFHILNQIGGTLVLDEADFRHSAETSDITKILNNGHAKGFPVLRCEQNQQREFTPKAYTVYSPKLIASRYSYQDDALESRCITLDLHFKRTRQDIPLTLPNTFDEEATALRNKLLAWRFHQFKKPRPLQDHHNASLTSRLNQIYAPLLCLVDDNQTYKEIVAFARASAEQARVDRGLGVEAHLLKVIMSLSGQSTVVTIGAIATCFNEGYGHQYERKITSHWIGGMIRNKLRLRTRKAHEGYIIAEGQGELLERLYERFDVSE